MAVNCWNEPAPAVRSFIREQGIRYPVLLEGRNVAMDYKVRGIPTTLFIDKEGVIVTQRVGRAGESWLEEQIQRILP
jgi:cytochrome c biogenesis protein CcmG, thiol:disulfide interchange protein DsbE